MGIVSPRLWQDFGDDSRMVLLMVAKIEGSESESERLHLPN